MGLHQVRRKPEPVQVQALPETGFFNYRQAAKYLHLPIARLRILQRAGKLNRIPGTHAHLFAKEELDRFRREQTATNGNGTTRIVGDIAEEAKQAGRAAVKNGDIRPPWEREFERLRGNRKKST
jgi:hypothetical protein